MTRNVSFDATIDRDGQEITLHIVGGVYLPVDHSDPDDAEEVDWMTAVALESCDGKIPAGSEVELSSEEYEDLAELLIQAAYDALERRRQDFAELKSKG